ncbi:patatin-like phospholipase family protein [Sphingomonas sp. ID1715]|uniref:patatin-like phospholipase family protein n=1 Tax=Sphingomonas sp. ID1715 TaxID=1656898 RepID=UPI001489B883|nr:patatin-like phospholipase family protein [Sphingomonas sp. ID1715]NNM76206.1 patatin-like phospholipase family protein [Sphingomonas sp. ID1715]
MAEADSGIPRRRKAAMPLPQCVALVLQGGGALGSYQAGVYEALDTQGIAIDRVAGVSIGAINAALIAGNPPELRVARLREFWELVSSWLPSLPIPGGDLWREWVHEWSAGFVATAGVPGFFGPRTVPPVFAPPGTLDALSFYDNRQLKETLDRLVDWDLLNDGPLHFSVGAVDIETGNLRYFDSRTERIDARHVMASGALPPGLPPVEIDGKLWWDGGIVSNTPLADVLATQDKPMLVFQVDLFPAAGAIPRTIMDVFAREKEIRYSSRTRRVSDQLLRLRKARRAVARLLKKLPEELRDDPDVAFLRGEAEELPVNVVQLIYRANDWESGSRDFEFSTRSMCEHWAAGGAAVMETIDKAELLARNIVDGKTAAFDLTRK